MKSSNKYYNISYKHKYEKQAQLWERKTKKQVLTTEFGHLRRWSFHSTSTGAIRRFPIMTPKRERLSRNNTRRRRPFPLSILDLKGQKWVTEGVVGGALTEGSEPLETTSASLTSFCSFVREH